MSAGTKSIIIFSVISEDVVALDFVETHPPVSGAVPRYDGSPWTIDFKIGEHPAYYKQKLLAKNYDTNFDIFRDIEMSVFSRFQHFV